MAVGNRVRAKVVKNKIAPPFRQAEFDIMFDEGISATGDLLDLAVEEEVIDKSGAWFSYGDVRLGQGRENVKGFLKENLDLFDEIKQKVLESKGVMVWMEKKDPANAPEPAAAAADTTADGGGDESDG